MVLFKIYLISTRTWQVLILEYNIYTERVINMYNTQEENENVLEKYGRNVKKES